MKPKMKDIANALGVSTATVSNVLSGKGRVSKPVAEKVLAEAMRKGYLPGGPGRALRTGRSGVLGLVLPDLAHPLFPRMAQALQDAAEAAGYGILIADSRGDSAAQAEAIRRLRLRGADGLILVPRRGTEIGATPGPVVVIDRPAAPANTVSADHKGGGALIARHLLVQGHHRLIFAGESRSSNVQGDRIAGMFEALPEAATAQEVWLEETTLNAIVAEVRAGVTAIATTSDTLALRVLTALQSAGLSVPGDVSLTGFDDLVFSAALNPPLTTVTADQAAIARHAIAALIALIHDGRHLPRAVEPMRIVARASTAAPRLSTRIQPTQQENDPCRPA